MRIPPRTGGQVRLGVAIGVPEPYGSALQAQRARFGDPLARDIPPHVTLLGPTVVDAEAMDAVTDHLAAAARSHAPFTVHLRGTGTFRPVSAVVFVQVVRGIAECEQLEAAVRSGPLDGRVRFNYHPHVTVAHDVDEDSLDRAFAELAGFEAVFPVDHFEIFRHGDDGVWRSVRRFPLTGDRGVTSRG